ncbi:MAG: DUF262 domain-containing protein [Bacteroidales bacterium]|nr:DUF262 domain-containing protein [Bacteroidales bacterium]MBR6179388.1 DUF262 domain-containing protein [Bacteroidales bacterium]
MIEQYNIGKLFQDYTLFVPEIQREYVWDSDVNCQKVMIPFLRSLNHNLQSGIYNIGFLYSYTNSDKDNYIIDGQQRFTTVVLLLYVLAIREDKKFEEYIGVEKPTMRFAYSVRPQTESFMRNLFRSRKVTKEDIYNQIWFLPEYSFDITINSIINAVETMWNELTNLQNLTFEKIINNVTFWYFNIEETSQGEELYITMNSRGQKLTNTEQIKPHLFDKLKKDNKGDYTDYGKLWDDWEEFFYSKKGKRSIQSVDIAMNSFLRVIYEMETQKEYRGEIPTEGTVLDLPLIKRYMDAMQKSAGDELTKLFAGNNAAYQAYIVLKALIAEGLKELHRVDDDKRIYRIFTNIVERRKYNLNQTELLSFLSEYAKSSQPFYDFVLEHKDFSENIFDQHELCKIGIYKMYDNDLKMQEKVELAFADAESKSVWSGDITLMINYSLCKSEDIATFDFELFREYTEKFNELFGDDKLKRETMDLTRRAILASEFHNYPRIFHGYTNISFAYEASDWNDLFFDKDNHSKLKTFLDNYKGKYSLNLLIEQFDSNKDWAEFVKKDYLLEYCEHKNIQWNEQFGWLLIKRENKKSYCSVINHHLVEYLKFNMQVPSKWSSRIWNGGRVVVENTKDNIVFDIWYHKEWHIQLFKRESESKKSLKEYVDDKWTFNGERYETSINFESVNQYEYPNVRDFLRGIIENMK